MTDAGERCAADFLRGYATAMHRNGLQPDRGPADDGGLSWSAKPGAFVCLGAQRARVFKLRMDSQLSGGRVSVAAMALPHETHMPIGLTAYEVDPSVITDLAVRMVVDAAPGDDPREVIVPGRFCDRGTCYPTNGRTMSPPQQVVL